MKWWRLLLGGLAALSVSVADAQVSPRARAPGFKPGLKFFGSASFPAATVTGIGKQADGNTANPIVTITTTATCAASASTYMVVAAGTEGTVSPTAAIADSAVNTWNNSNGVVNGTSLRIRLYYAPVTVTLPSGGTIALTFGNGTANRMLVAACVTGLAASAFDSTGTSGGGTLFGSGTTATTAVPQSGTFSTSASAILSWVMWSGGAADTLGAAPGFTVVDTALLGSALRMEYQIVNTNAAISYSPTDGTSRNWVLNFVAFKAIP